jgi:hypothetical protein
LGKWLFSPIKNGAFEASLPHIEEYFGCGNKPCKGVHYKREVGNINKNKHDLI